MIRDKRQLASMSLVVIAVASAAWAMRMENRPPLTVNPTEKALGQLASAQVVEIPFRFHNGSSRPIRFVGASMHCKRTGCFGTETTFPVTIPAGGDWVLDASYKAVKPGSFSHLLVVYTDCEQAPQVVLSVTGKVVKSTNESGS